MAATVHEVKLLLEAQDRMSGPVAAALNNVRSATSGLASVAANITGVGKAAEGLGNAGAGVTKLTASLGSMVALGAGIAGFQGALSVLQQGFAALSDAVIGFNSLQERTQIAFTTLFGGGDEAARKAKAFTEQLKTFAAQTPFDYPELLKAAQGFVGVGVAAENVIPILKNVAGAAIAAGRTSADISGITRALQQIMTTGRLQADEMNQLAERGIPAWRILGESIRQTGESLESAIARARKLSETGQISANQFFNAFNKYAETAGWDKLVESAGATFEGAMSNIRDSLRFLAGDAFKPLFDQISTGAQAFDKLLKTDAVKQFSADIRVTVEQLISAFEPLGRAIGNIFSGFQTGGASGALSALMDEVTKFGREMFGAGYDLVAEFAGGILSGASGLIQDAANAVAEIIASYLIGNSPPPTGPLSAIDAGGRAVGEAWVQGFSQGFAGVDQIAVRVSDAFGNATKALTVDQGRGAFVGAKGNLEGLQKAAEDAEGAIRTLDNQIRQMDNVQSNLKETITGIKDSYGDQIDSLNRSVDAIKEQNTYAERYADLIQKQNDAISSQADLQDRIRLNELKAAQLAAEGDPVKRAALVAQQEALKAREDDLRLAKAERDLDRRQQAQAEARAKAAKDGKDFNQKDFDIEEQQIRLDREQLAVQRQLAGLTDKQALAQIAAQRSQIEAAATTRKIEEDRARASTQAIKNAAEIERAQKGLQALPLEEEARRLAKERDEALRPLQQSLEMAERMERAVQRQRKEWQGLKGDIADAIKEQKADDKAAVAAAKAGSQNTPLNLPRQEIDMSLADAGTRAGRSLLTGVQQFISTNGAQLIGGALFGILGANLFGPLGLAAGAAFGAQLGAALQQRIPDIGAALRDKVNAGIQGVRDLLDRTGDAWAPWASEAGAAGDAVGQALSGVNGILLALQLALQGNMPAAAEAFRGAMGNLVTAADLAVQAIGNLMSIDTSGAESTADRLGTIWEVTRTRIDTSVNEAIAAVARFVGADLTGADTKVEAVAIIWETVKARIDTAVTEIIASAARYTNTDISGANTKVEAVAAIWETVATRVDGAVNTVIGALNRLIGAPFDPSGTAWFNLGSIFETIAQRATDQWTRIQQVLQSTEFNQNLSVILDNLSLALSNLGTLLSPVAAFLGKLALAGVAADQALNPLDVMILRVSKSMAEGAFAIAQMTEFLVLAGSTVVNFTKGLGGTFEYMGKLIEYVSKLGEALQALQSLDIDRAGRAFKEAMDIRAEAVNAREKADAPFQAISADIERFNKSRAERKAALDQALKDSEEYLKRRREQATRELQGQQPIQGPQLTTTQTEEIATAQKRRMAEAARSVAAGWNQGLADSGASSEAETKKWAELNANAVRDAWMIRSPSQVAMQMALDVVAGFNLGIEAGAATTVAAMQILTTAVSEAFLAIPATVQAAWAMVSDVTTSTTAAMQATVGEALDSIGTAVDSGMTAITQAIDTGWQGTSQATTAAMTAIDTAVETGWTAVSASTTQAMAALTTLLQTTWASILVLIQTVIDAIVAALVKWGTDALAAIRTGGAVILEAITAFTGQWLAEFSAKFDAILALIGPWASALSKGTSRALTDILAGITGTLQAWVDAGTTLGQGFVESLTKTITEAAGSLVEAVKGTVSGAWNAARGMLPGGGSGGGGNLRRQDGSLDLEALARMNLNIDPSKGRDETLRQWAPVLRAIEQSGGPLAQNIAAIILAENGAGQAGRAVPEGKNWFSIQAANRKFQNGTIPSGRWANYESDSASLADFLDLIMNNPRYADAWQNRQGPTENFIGGLVKGNYIVPEPGYPVEPWIRNTSQGAQTFQQVAGSIPAMQAAMTTAVQNGVTAAMNQAGRVPVVQNALASSYWTSGGTHGGSPAADIFAPKGSPIYAPVGGTSMPARYRDGGEATIIQGDDGKYYYMAHGNVPFAGGRVEAGQRIGEVGDSGNARGTSPHLHYAIASNPGIFDQRNGSGDITGGAFDWMQQGAGGMGPMIEHAHVLVNALGEVSTAYQQLAIDGTTAIVTVQEPTQATTEITRSYAEELMAGLAPAGATAGNSIQQMTASIDPLLSQIAAGTLTTDQLVTQLAQLAANAGLTDAPFNNMQTSTADAALAMYSMFQAAAAIDPAMAGLAQAMQATGADAQTMAVIFSQGVANSAGVANAALGQMAGAVGPLVSAVGSGQISGEAFSRTLVELAARAGLTTAPFRNLQDGVIDTGTALRRVIEATAGAGPQFAALNERVNAAGTVSEDAAREFLTLVSAFGRIEGPTERATQNAEEFGQQTQQMIPEIALLSQQITVSAQQGMAGFSEAVTNGVRSVLAAVAGMTEEAHNAAYPVGQALVGGFLQGQSEGAEAAVEQARDIARRAIAAMREEAQAHSPSEKTRELGWNLNEGVEMGQLEDAKYPIDAGKKVVTDTIQGMRDAADAHSPSNESWALGNDVVEGLVLGTSESAQDVVSAGQQVIGGAISSWTEYMREPAFKVGEDIIDTINAALQGGQLNALGQQSASAFLAIVQEYTAISGDLEASTSRQLELQTELAREAARILPLRQELAALQEQQEAAERGSIGNQMSLADLEEFRLKRQGEIIALQKEGLASQQKLADLERQQSRAQAGSLDSRLRAADAQQRLAQLAVEEARANQNILPLRNQIRDVQWQIEDAQRGSVEQQQAAIAADAESARRKLGQLKIEDQLANASKQGLSQDQINALFDQRAGLQASDEGAARAAEIAKLQQTIDLAPQQQALVGLQDQERQATRAGQPSADEKAAIEAELALTQAYNDERAAGFNRAIVLAQEEVQGFEDRSRVIQEQIDMADLLTKEIENYNAVAAAGYQKQIILAEDRLRQEETHTRALQKSLEQEEARLKVYQAQEAQLRQLADVLRHLGVLSEEQSGRTVPGLNVPTAPDPERVSIDPVRETGGGSSSGSEAGGGSSGGASGASGGASGASKASGALEGVGKSADTARTAVTKLNTTLDPATVKAAGAAATAASGLTIDLGAMGSELDTLDGKATSITIDGQQVRLSDTQLHALTDTLNTVSGTPVTVTVNGQELTLGASEADALREQLNLLDRVTTKVAVDDKAVADAQGHVDELGTKLDDTVNADWEVQVSPAQVEEATETTQGLDQQLDTTIGNPTWPIKVDDVRIDESTQNVENQDQTLHKAFDPTYVAKVDDAQIDTATITTSGANTELDKLPTPRTVNVNDDSVEGAVQSTGKTLTNFQSLQAGAAGTGWWNAVFGVDTQFPFKVGNIEASSGQLDGVQLNDIGNVEAAGKIDVAGAMDVAESLDISGDADVGDIDAGNFKGDKITTGDAKLNDAVLRDVQAEDAQFEGSDIEASDVDTMDVSDFNADLPSSAARALGGPVMAGVAHTVGEGGRELYVPPMDGMILNHAATERVLRDYASVAPRAGAVVAHRAMGGYVRAGRTYETGEMGREGYIPFSGVGSYASGPQTIINRTNEFNLTINTNAGTENVIHDFGMMRAMLGDNG